MTEVEPLLAMSAVTIGEEDPKSQDVQYCLGEYFRELSSRFEGGFEPIPIESPTAGEFVPPHGTFLVMRLSGAPVGCGALKRISSHIAYFRRMWVAPGFRGFGLGKRLLQSLEDRARSVGYRTVRLETNKALTEALQLYGSFGYKEIAPFSDEKHAHHWLEKTLKLPTDAS